MLSVIVLEVLFPIWTVHGPSVRKFRTQRHVVGFRPRRRFLYQTLGDDY